MNMRVRALGLLFCSTILSACGSPEVDPSARPERSIVREGDVLDITFGGTATYARVHFRAEPKPFVYPLRGPGGIALTRGFPMEEIPGEPRDHPHHQSLWFAHGDVNGFDFWHGSGRGERMVAVGEPEILGPAADARGKPVLGSAGVRCRYRWKVEDDRTLCTEERSLWFQRTDDCVTADVLVTLTAVEPLVFGDTKEGTFALRVHPALQVEGDLATGHLVDSEGRKDGDVWGKRARWIDDSGTIAGAGVGVALFDHPSNPRHPTWWHARTYGLLAANPFGVHDFEGKPAGTGSLELPAGSTLRLFYRVVLHGAGWDAARIDAAYRDWVETFPAPPREEIAAGVNSR